MLAPYMFPFQMVVGPHVGSMRLIGKQIISPSNKITFHGVDTGILNSYPLYNKWFRHNHSVLIFTLYESTSSVELCEKFSGVN